MVGQGPNLGHLKVLSPQMEWHKDGTPSVDSSIPWHSENPSNLVLKLTLVLLPFDSAVFLFFQKVMLSFFKQNSLHLR